MLRWPDCTIRTANGGHRIRLRSTSDGWLWEVEGKKVGQDLILNQKKIVTITEDFQSNFSSQLACRCIFFYF